MSTIVTRAGKGTPLTATDHDNNLNNLNTDKLESTDIGVTVQAWDAQLDDISALAVTDSNIIVGDGTNWVAETGATARTSLGVSIGSDVQAWDAQLDDIAALAVTDSNIIVGDGTNWVVETGATARTSLGLGIGVDVQAYDANNALTDVAQTFSAAQRASVTVVTVSTGTYTPAFSDNNDFSFTLSNGAAETLANPSGTIVPGQSGSIFITQNGTGASTLSYGTYWDFVGGSAPVVSTGLGAVDRLDYHVRTATSIHAVLSKAIS